MAVIKRLKTSDFVINGKDLLNESSSIQVIDQDNSFIVTNGKCSMFFGMDNYLAALMIKHGIHEVDLTDEDLAKVDTFVIDWHGDGKQGATLTANRLPMTSDKEVVPILQYSTGFSYDQTEKKYWDFYKPELSDKGIVCMLLVPKNIINEKRVEHIHTIQNKSGYREYRPFNQKADVVELNKDNTSNNTNQPNIIKKAIRWFSKRFE